MRLLYSLLWWASLPLVLMRLWWRGRKEPGYRQHIAERLGFYDGPAPGGKLIWLHAVSVGETRAAEPLIRELLEVFPDCGLLLTHMTPTGRATGRELYGKYGDRLRQVYLPYDTGWMVRRFLAHFAPRLCILMETEVWPNLIAQCNQRHVPVALVNARLSERSLARAGRFGGLLQQAAQGIACIAAQTEADAAQLTMPFAPGAVWVCFSDQTSHAVMSGQYMLEQTFHLPANAQYDTASSPLAILTRLTGRPLI